MNRIVFSLLDERRCGAYVEKSEPEARSLHRIERLSVKYVEVRKDGSALNTDDGGKFGSSRNFGERRNPADDRVAQTRTAAG
jgi:hypothetical protein